MDFDEQSFFSTQLRADSRKGRSRAASLYQSLYLSFDALVIALIVVIGIIAPS